MDSSRIRKLTPGVHNPAGRVAVDSRGRNVWQWNDDQLDSTTIMLARLDNDALAIEPTRRQPTLGQSPRIDADTSISAVFDPGDLSIEPTLKAKVGGGFDPYNRS